MKACGPVWFLETKSFTSTWKDLNLGVEDLMSLQDQIKIDPTMNPVIKGTGGLRKVRFSPPRSNMGKRGSMRVCYAFFDRFSAIVLLEAYRKNEMENLSAAEKKVIKNVLAEFECEIEKKMG